MEYKNKIRFVINAVSFIFVCAGSANNISLVVIPTQALNKHC